mmetsp:Transcript_28199/g.47805  ORF Transcript_28199/g.47805 Transcript_28199/m.47805 type:complete len:301 (-) Transcript_28199:368-1270(-)
MAMMIDCCYYDDLHWQVRNAHKACAKPTLTYELTKVLADDSAKKLTSNTKPFWFVIHGIIKFMEKDSQGFLPVCASIPDMTSLPEMYVKLQKLFRARERQDLDKITAHVNAALESVGKEKGSISTDYIDRIAKHIRTVSTVRCQKIETAYDAKQSNADDLNEIFSEWEEPKKWDVEADGPPPIQPKNIYWYFGMRAAERFRTKKGRYPGAGKEEDVGDDTKALTEIMTTMFKEYHIQSKIEPAICQEIVRFGAKEVVEKEEEEDEEEESATILQDDAAMMTIMMMLMITMMLITVVHLML